MLYVRATLEGMAAGLACTNMTQGDLQQLASYQAAMEKAEALVRAYAAAGIQKIHIDASMRLGSDDPQAPLDPAVVARRAARLCRAAEEARPEGELPLYVVGSEVPIPGVSGKTVLNAVLAHRPDAQASYMPDRHPVVDHMVKTARPGDLILTVGAGDIYKAGDSLLKEP